MYTTTELLGHVADCLAGEITTRTRHNAEGEPFTVAEIKFPIEGDVYLGYADSADVNAALEMALIAASADYFPLASA